MANNTAPTQEHCLIIDEIDPIAQLIKQAPNFVPSKLRVAAYARVSTEQDEQASSYEAQVDYYTRSFIFYLGRTSAAHMRFTLSRRTGDAGCQAECTRL